MLSPGPWTGDCGVTDVDGSGRWSIQGAGVLLSTALSSTQVKLVMVSLSSTQVKLVMVLLSSTQVKRVMVFEPPLFVYHFKRTDWLW